jgi:hypothetical protein
VADSPLDGSRPSLRNTRFIEVIAHGRSEPQHFRKATLQAGTATARPDRVHVPQRTASIARALIDAQPEVYNDDIPEEVRAQLLKADGVLVWVDPIHEGRTREVLDQMLRDVATRGPWVSAHPDVIIKMGVKEVLYRTKHLGWGTDTHLYQSMAEFLATFPRRLRTHGPLVIKQNRGNGGHGVLKS